MERNNKRASIKDVARCANVSTSTVSRYFNGGYLSPKSQEAVAKAIELLDYHPSSIAKALVSQDNKSIAVITADISLYGSSQLIQGISLEAGQEGYLVNITLLNETGEDPTSTIEMLIRSQLSGCIILDMSENSKLHQQIVSVSRRIPTILTGSDDIRLSAFEGGYQLTRYLLSLGHATVYHVSIPETGDQFTRKAGWFKALSEGGRRIPEPIVSSWDPAETEEIGMFLARSTEATAVFAGNDEIAAGVMRGITLAGKHVPDDISVVGFDGSPIASLTIPSITTWKQDFQSAGRGIVRKLLHMKDKSGESTRRKGAIPVGNLIVGESTASCTVR